MKRFHSTDQRIRGRKLQAIRKRVLAREPRCVDCLRKGITRLAVHVDHIVALVNEGKDDPHDDANRQGLCLECHDRKSLADLGLKPKGGDASGNPTDPRHHWNRTT